MLLDLEKQIYRLIYQVCFSKSRILFKVMNILSFSFTLWKGWLFLFQVCLYTSYPTISFLSVFFLEIVKAEIGFDILSKKHIYDLELNLYLNSNSFEVRPNA